MAHTNQGGVKNYLGKQKIVKAPLHWQSAPNHPTTELAYITKKEKDLLIKKDLHKSLKGGVNRGPSGIISLNGWGDAPSSTAPGQQSGPETGKSFGDQEKSVTMTAPGEGTRTVTTSPKDTFAQSWSGQPGFLGFGGGYRELKTPGVTPEYGGAYKSRLGGILGILGKGALSLFGGIPGKLMSGIMTAKDWAKKKGTNIFEGVKEFGEHDNFMDYYNRNKVQPVEAIDVPYDPNERISETAFSDLSNVNNQNFDPNFYAGNKEGGRIGYNRGRVVNPGGYSGEKDWLSLKGYDDMMKGMSDDEIIQLFDSVRGTWSKAEGGRIGYKWGSSDPEEPAENIFEFMKDQGIEGGGEMVSDEWNDRLLENLFDKYIDQGFSPADAEKMALEEFELMSQAPEQDQGIASLV